MDINYDYFENISINKYWIIKSVFTLFKFISKLCIFFGKVN